MKKLKAAVIGVGNMGRHHARIYSKLSQTNLIAIADINEKISKALAKKYRCRFYTDYKKMLDEEELDVVSIATPTSLHYKIALDCIKRKINVLVEKPIASTLGQAEIMINEAKKQDVTLMVGHIERFNPAVRKIKDMVARGLLGEVRCIISKRVGMPATGKVIDANVIVDIGIHDIDILNYLYNSVPEKIVVAGGRAFMKDREDHADIFLKYPPCKSGYVQVNWITPKKIRKICLTGTKGHVEADYITQQIELYKHPYKHDIKSGFESFVRSYVEAEKEIILVKKEEPLKLEMLNFVNNVLGEEKLEISPKEALLALKIALQASKILGRQER